MPSFEKAAAVDEDIKSIVTYTAERWGIPQVRKYMAGLEVKMEEFAQGAAHSKSLDHLIDGLKVIRYEHHYIFGVTRIDAPMLIIAILHEKMDMITRLKKRLD